MHGKKRRSRAIGSWCGWSLLDSAPGLLPGLLLGALLGLTGCDNFFTPVNPNPPANGGDSLYVANGGNTFIAGFSVSSTGGLSVLNNSPYNNGVAANALAMTPNDKYLYASGALGGIYEYLINSDGSISVQNNGSPLVQDVIATTMRVDSTGTYLLAAGVGVAAQAQAIGIYQINSSNGVLTALGGSPITLYLGTTKPPPLTTPTGLLITPDNTKVYVSLGNLGVQVLTLSTGGALSSGNAPTILPPYSKSTSPSDTGLASDPNSKFLFVAEINTGLRALSIGTGGALNEISGSPYTAGSGPTAVMVDPTGAYVYVTNKQANANGIYGFTLNTTSGQLTAITGSPFSSVGALPIAMATDSSKKYLAVANNGGNPDLQLFSFSTTTPGALVAGASATTGTDPTGPQAIAATLPSTSQ